MRHRTTRSEAARSRLDLHVHTTASDGTLTPSEVVDLAKRRGLSTIAITDHDTIGGIAEAEAAGEEAGLAVIPGVEINAQGRRRALHILGYYLDPASPLLNERLHAMQEARLDRAEEMIERLETLGVSLDREEVLALAGGESVGRPHIAQALVNRGAVETIDNAFERLIGRGGPAFVSRPRLTLQEAIESIVRAGGVAVLAHPIHSGEEAIARIPELVGYGLRGLEVYYPHQRAEETERLLALCGEHDLLATGGTDFHGPDVKEEDAPLGSVYVPTACLEPLRAAAGRG